MPIPRLPKFTFLGSHPAIDFVNTVVAGRKGTSDLLADPASWERWLFDAVRLWPETFGREPVSAAIRRSWTQEDYQRSVLRMREVLTRAFGDVATEGALTPESLVALNDAARTLRGALRLEVLPKGGLRSRLAPDGPDHLLPLARILEAAHELLARGKPARLRRCAREGCPILFLDRSRTGRRRWCSMRICGNRVKVARHFHKTWARERTPSHR